MLKLERLTKKLELSVTLRKREPFFNREMVQAMALGIALHLFFFFLFPIATLKFHGSQLFLPPVSVAADIPSSSGAVTIEMNQEEMAASHLEPPSLWTLSIPEVDLTIFPKIASYSGDVSFEQQHLNYPLLSLLDSLPKPVTPFQIHVSGPLSDVSFFLNYHVPPIPEGLFKASFLVRMENQTGKIFWYEYREEPQNEAMRQLAQEVLNHLQFVKNKNLFVTDGEVEIIFSSSGQV
jgi:hypothetical protein